MVAIRRTVPAAQLSTALSQNEARSATANLVGPAAGGALFGLGRSLPFLVDAVSFGVSLLCVLGIRTPLRVETGTEPGQHSVRADIAEGFRWIWTRRHLRALLLFSTAVNVAGSATLLAVIVLARADGASPTAVGLVLTGAAIGGLAGTVVSARLQRHFPPYRLMLLVGAIASVSVPAMAIPLGVAWIGAMLAVIILFTPAVTVAISLTIMRGVPERLQGRLFAAMILLISGAQPLGPLVAGLSLEYVGNSPTMLLLGGYLLVVTVVAALRPNFRNPDVDRAVASPDDTDGVAGADDDTGSPDTQSADPPVTPATD